MLALVDYLLYVAIERTLDLLLDIAFGGGTFVIAVGKLAALHLLLTVLPPVVSIARRFLDGKIRHLRSLI